MSVNLLELRDVAKVYGSRRVIDGVGLKIKPGTVTSIIGPSGSGKTTLLRCMCLLDYIDEGEILFNSAPVVSSPISPKRTIEEKMHSPVRILVDEPEYRRKVGMVLQDYTLWPSMNVLENVILGMIHARGFSRGTAIERAKETMGKLGLSRHLDKTPSKLSGGERQRVALARALLMEYQVLLLDEVTSALDPEAILDVMNIIYSLVGSGTTLILATHHLPFAREISNSIIVLVDGAITDIGDPEHIFNSPKSERTAKFTSGIMRAFTASKPQERV
jgi:ABC-type polar amino acid transport system ATPase subunit